MIVDSITEEIRAIRRKLAAECGNDLARIFAEARQREAADGRSSVILPPRRVQTTSTPQVTVAVPLPQSATTG
jgi:hypothetical protein